MTTVATSRIAQSSASALLLTGVFFASPAGAGFATDWNAVALELIREERVAPPAASRALAMTHVAIFDAVNSSERGYRPYHVQVAATPGSSPEAAAAASAHAVLRGLFPGRADRIDAALAASLGGLPPSDGVGAGVALGRSVGASILDLRSGDGAGAHVDYHPGDGPGEWRPTPPGYAPALGPQWPAVTPFAISSGDAFRPDAPPALGSVAYADAFAEVKALGSAESTLRTADQTHAALFWSAGSGTVTPPGMWNQVARVVSASEGLTLIEEARLFGLLNVAMADAAISSWDAKFHHEFWRPVTAIREADVDGNPLTDADPLWTPLLVTPPFPSYTSGHSTFSGAASGVLGLFFGTDALPFTLDGVGGPRSFSGFEQAADEAGRSRIFGGIHFEFDNRAGLAAGRGIGRFAFETRMTAVPEPPSLALASLGLMGLGLGAARSRRKGILSRQAATAASASAAPTLVAGPGSGMEVQFVVEDDERGRGRPAKARARSIGNVVDPAKRASRGVRRWNTPEVAGRGDLIRVAVNETTTAEVDAARRPELSELPRAGYLNLSNIRGQGRGVEFRFI